MDGYETGFIREKRITPCYLEWKSDEFFQSGTFDPAHRSPVGTHALEKMAEEISKIKGFPKNYILDIGEFLKDEKLVPDVVELNPITPAMCYVNNSIFTER